MPGPTVFFCESKYAVVPWVYEFWNTASNAGYAWVGLRAPAATPRLRAARRAMLAVGAGSALLHGTGTAAGQMADELAMLLLVLRMLECTAPRPLPAVRWTAGAVAAVYVALGWYRLFVLLFILLVGVTVASMRLDPALRRGAPACGAWMVGAFVLWATEQTLCARAPALAWCHVGWHLSTARAGWLFFACHAQKRQTDIDLD